MANFDPTTPPQFTQPTVFYAGQPIREPKADVSGEIMGRGVSADIRGGAEAADATVKSSIERTVYNQADQISDDYIGRLSSARSVLYGPQGGGTLTDSGTPDGLPKPLQQLPQQVQGLVSARQNGKLSDVDYKSKLDQLARTTRKDYGGGYTDFVDETIGRATERTPANRLIQSLTQDIDAYVGRARAATDKADNQVEGMAKEGLLSPQEFAMYQSKKIDAHTALAMGNKRSFQKFSTGMAIQGLEYDEKSREASARKAKDVLTPSVYGDISDQMSALWIPVGGNKSEGPTQLINDIRTHKLNPTTEQMTGISRFLIQSQEAGRATLWSKLNKPYTDGPNKGITPVDILGGPKAANEWLDEQYRPWKDLIGQFTSPETGFNFLAAKTAQGIVDDARNKDYQLNPFLVQNKVLMGDLGQSPYVKDWFDRVMEHQSGIRAGLDDTFNRVAQSLATQTSGNKGSNSGDFINTDNPYTLMQGIEEAQKSTPVPSADTAKLYMAQIDFTSDYLTSKKSSIPVKKNIAAGVFHPADAPVIKKFEPDHLDTSGKPVPGQTKFLTRMVSPEMTEAMYKLGPKQFQDYVQTSTHWFDNTFSEQIRLINEQSNNPNVQVQFDPKTGWSMKMKRPQMFGNPSPIVRGMLSPRQTAENGYTMEDQRMAYSLQNINSAIQSMTSIAKKTGMDLNGYVLGLMYSAGLEKNSNAYKLLSARINAEGLGKHPKETKETELPL